MVQPVSQCGWWRSKKTPRRTTVLLPDRLLSSTNSVCLGNSYPADGYVAAQELKEGNQYVFSTEYYPREKWHEIRVDPFGWMVLSKDAPPDEASEAGDDDPPCDMATGSTTEEPDNP